MKKESRERIITQTTWFIGTYYKKKKKDAYCGLGKTARTTFPSMQ